MFRCIQCGKNSNAGEKQHKKVIAKREKRYSNGGVGWEIMKEMNVCSKCVAG